MRAAFDAGILMDAGIVDSTAQDHDEPSARRVRSRSRTAVSTTSASPTASGASGRGRRPWDAAIVIAPQG